MLSGAVWSGGAGRCYSWVTWFLWILFTEHNVCEGMELSNQSKASLERLRSNGGANVLQHFCLTAELRIGSWRDSGHDGGNLWNSKEGPSDAKCSPPLRCHGWPVCVCMAFVPRPSAGMPFLLLSHDPVLPSLQGSSQMPPTPHPPLLPYFSIMRLTACTGLNCPSPHHKSLNSSHWYL